jgi:glutamine cyclotransferase
MKDKLNAARQLFNHSDVPFGIGLTAGVVLGSAVTVHFIKSARVPHILDLSKEAYTALINDDTLNGIAHVTPDRILRITKEV